MSKTLLSINNYYYRRGGAEAVFLDHNQMMTEAGWDVVPFAMQHPQNLPSEWSEYFVRELEFGGDYGVFERISMASKVVYSFEAQDKISRLIRRTQPDLAHLHNIYHHISPSILSVLKSESVPTIMTLHDLKLACPAYKMLTHDGLCERCKGGKFRNLVAHKCLKNSTAVSALVYIEARLHRLLNTYSKCIDNFVVPSRFLADKLSEWGLDRDRMIYIPNFVDLDYFQVRTEISDYFLYMGRLSTEKGLDTLINASAVSGVQLKIVGTGPEAARLLTKSKTIDADIEFMGYLEGAALQQVLGGAKALVLPTEGYENAPISVLEAYASGVPVIGANIGGIPELIEHGVTGLVFTSGSVPDLARALTDFNQLSESEIVAMGTSARSLVEERFSKEGYIERILQVYGELGVQGVASM